MRRIQFTAILALFALCTLGGCLSLGGTIVSKSPETASRLESLEARVSAIEQRQSGR